MKALYLDLETTGTNPYSCGIHQVAATAVVGGGEWEKVWHIKPHDGAIFQDGWDVADVGQETVRNYPTTDEQFYTEFLAWLTTFVNKFDRQDKMFLIGWNTRFDEDFLRQVFKRRNNNFFGSYFFTPSLDVMQLAAWQLAHVRPTLANFKQTTVYEYLFAKELEDAHDALADIRATREIYKQIRREQLKAS